MNKRKSLFLKRRSVRIQWIKSVLNNKRQKFVVSVVLLSAGVFFSEHLFGNFNIFLLFFLAIFTNLLFFLSTYSDVKGNFSPLIFILPFIYTFSFGLFYSLVPARFLTRAIITSFYAVGLYSLFLSQNIFIVASIRTITLVSSARIVSFVLTLVSYFFLLNIIFSLHLSTIPLSALIFVFSFFLVAHSLWTHTLSDRSIFSKFSWSFAISLCLSEISLILSLWPSTPTVIALFLTGFFYTIVGIAQVWLDKRLFKGVIWEFIWVAVIVLFILILFTSWK